MIEHRADTASPPELRALLEGAATLSRSGNRVAAIAALLSAIGAAPDDRSAHRRLAAAYAIAGDRDSARAEYDRFISRLEVQGAFGAAALERAYAAAVLAPAPPIEPVSGHRRLTRLTHLTQDQSVALRRVAIAVVAVAATFGVMFVAGAQIFASGGAL